MLQSPHNWGATPENWSHFDLVLGLGADLLPVVSNPSAKISEKSKMKSLGKTPSVYNREGCVAGIPNWTSKQARTNEIERWAGQSDYGICIQTRHVRALDIDVPNRELATDIVEFIGGELNWLGLPCRFRSNSSKCLLAFRITGEMPKRVLKVAGGIIEFLANGQQFIAVGEHFDNTGRPSGARYEWDWCEHSDFPELSLEAFESLWAALAREFGIAEASEGSLRKPKGSAAAGAPHDPVAAYLHEKGQVLSIGKDGQLNIECPFADEHTGDSGETSTSYFPPDDRYEQGHFSCLHAHCEGRTDADFLDAIGYRAADFEQLPAAPQNAEGVAEREPLPPFERNKKGDILSTIGNVTLAMSRPDVCRTRIAFDAFRDEIMLAPVGTEDWRPLDDADYSRMRIWLEKNGFQPVGREMIRDVVLLVASEHKFDSAITWLEGLVWDGVPRVETFLHDYFGTQDTPYTRSVSIYLWTALAGRVLSPGCKADMVPILIGAQGLGKSTCVASIAPDEAFFTEISLQDKDDDLARRMRGKLIGEIGELRGLNTKDLESINAFITRTHEKWVPKYLEFATSFPRRLVFVGTTNQDEFLADTTGNRRWLPLRVTKADVEAIVKNRALLWAEARERFTLFGIGYHDAERLAKEVCDQHMITDVWAEIIKEWLDTPELGTSEKPRTRGFVQVHEVLREALGFSAKNIQHRDKLRVGNVLRGMGFEKIVKRVDGELRKVWANKN